MITKDFIEESQESGLSRARIACIARIDFRFTILVYSQVLVTCPQLSFGSIVFCSIVISLFWNNFAKELFR